MRLAEKMALPLEQVVRRTLGGSRPQRGKKTRPVWSLFKAAQPRLDFYPGSIKYHHRWPGGLGDHTGQVITLLSQITIEHDYHVPGWKVVAAGLLHDWNKLFRYQVRDLDNPENLENFRMQSSEVFEYKKKDHIDPMILVGSAMARFDIPRDPELMHALTLSEGGWSPWARRYASVDTGPFAAFLHYADLVSAKVYGRVGSLSDQSNPFRTWLDWRRDEEQILRGTPDEELR